MAKSGYDRALIAYIDVLGFRNLVDETKRDWAKVTGTAEMLELVRRQFTSAGTHYVTKSTLRTYTFSDLVLRCSLPLDGGNLADVAEDECFNLARLQTRLLCDYGVLIRGGLCQGEIFFGDNDIVFGPGMVKAYTLEANYAVYPRIIVDRDVASTLVDQDRGFADSVHEAEDGAWFIDYLFMDLLAIHFGDGSGPTVLQVVQNHRDKVMQKFAEMNSGDERVKQKLKWLGLYHNRTVGRLADDISDPALKNEVLASTIPAGALRF